LRPGPNARWKLALLFLNPNRMLRASHLGTRENADAEGPHNCSGAPLLGESVNFGCEVPHRLRGSG
jgi:hypothetical protein